MPVKLDEEGRKERDAKKEKTLQNKERRKRHLETDDDPTELLSKARARMTLMRRIAKDFFDPDDLELEPLYSAEEHEGKMRYAHKKYVERVSRVKAAKAIRRQELIEQEEAKEEEFLKNFLYHQYWVGQYYAEFLEEVDGYDQ